MPPKNPRKRTSEPHESDNGVIADAPKTKKAKATSSKIPVTTPSNGKKRQSGAAEAQGEEFWEISNNRRVTISEFSGKKMVNIREYYEKDGESLPGKKGISMPVEQFSALVTLLPSIEKALRAQGIEVPRPDYGGVGEEGGGADVEGDGEIGEGDGGGDEGGRKNFEETSEEEG